MTFVESDWYPQNYLFCIRSSTYFDFGFGIWDGGLIGLRHKKAAQLLQSKSEPLE
jgi:hypothetical protein